MSEPSARPPIADAPLSVVLPAYNASPFLTEVVTDWVTCLDGLSRLYEILIVDDGSTDDTAALADPLTQRSPHVRLLRHAVRSGVGAALRTGIAVAQHPLLCCCACDRQYQPQELPRLLEMIDQVDLVTGYRTGRPVPLWLRGPGWVYRVVMRVLFGVSLAPLPSRLGWHGWGRRWLARWVFGVRVHDVDCAFRLFRRSLFERIPIQSDGPFAQVEILAKANFLGALMTEIPVTYTLPALGARAVDDPCGESILAAARTLFSQPDFGPALLPTPPPASSEPPVSAPAP